MSPLLRRLDVAFVGKPAADAITSEGESVVHWTMVYHYFWIMADEPGRAYDTVA